MKLWVDDIRWPPEEYGWVWVKTSADAIHLLEKYKDAGPAWNIALMSLDHDLGGDDTTRAVVLWCCNNDYWPKKVVVHSANPVGVEWLEGMIARYKP